MKEGGDNLKSLSTGEVLRNRQDILIRLLKRIYSLNMTGSLNYGRYENPYELLVVATFIGNSVRKSWHLRVKEFLKTWDSPIEFLKAYPEKVLIRRPVITPAKLDRLQKTLRLIVEKFNGKIPLTSNELERLPLTWTAKVILSFEYGQPLSPVLDVHQLRVLKRVLNLNFRGIKEAHKLLSEMLSGYRREWSNLAYILSTHGQLICKKGEPLCGSCQFRDICLHVK